MSAYDFVIRHRAGRKNPADGPSRRPDYFTIDDENMMLPTFQQKLRTARERGLCLDMGSSIKVSYDSDVPTVRQGTAGTDHPSVMVVSVTCAGRRFKSACAGHRSEVIRCLARNSIPRLVVTNIMATEDLYSTPSDSLLPLLKELQLGDALAVGKSKLVRKADTGLIAGWDLDPTDLLRY
jgi:hypothetical protein